MLLYAVLQIGLLVGIATVLWMVWDAWRRRYWRFVVAGIILTFLGLLNILALFFSVGGK